MGTIKSSREIDAIFRGAKRAAQASLILLVAETPEGRGRLGRVAFIAGKKLGGAVLRNRCRRVLRAAVAGGRRAPISAGPWPAWDVVLIARPGTAVARADTIDRDLSLALAKAGVT